LSFEKNMITAPPAAVKAAVFTFTGLIVLNCLHCDLWSLRAVADEIVNEEDEHQRQFAASLLRSLHANNNAISSFDVTILAESSYARPDGKIFSSETKDRIIWSERQRAGVRVSRVNVDVLDDETRAMTRGQTISEADGFVVVDERGRTRGSPGSLHQMRRMFAWPHLQAIGIVAFPYVLDRPEDESGLHSILSDEDRFSTLKTRDGGHAAIRRTIEGPTGTRIERNWVFDPQRLVPVSYATRVTEPSGLNVIKERERYRWKEINGIHVPLLISQDNLQVYVDRETGDGTDYVIHSDFRFTWHRVNEDIDEREVSPERFTSFDSLVEFVDFEKDADAAQRD
jgi:hypothetical protein